MATAYIIVYNYCEIDCYGMPSKKEVISSKRTFPGIFVLE